MTPPAAPRLHLAHIDGLRALCALWVLLYHTASTSGLALPFALRWIAWGHFAVPAFIVISGFCLMMPVARSGELKGGASHFYRRRIRRILPPYYAALVLWIVVGHVRDWRDILSHLLLLHNVTPSTFYKINASFWSIAVECQIYVFFPLFVGLWRRQGMAHTLIGVLFVSYLANAALSYTAFWGLCLHYIGLFAIGAAGAVCAFSAQEKIRRFRERFAWPAASGVSALLLWGITWRLGHPPQDEFNNVALISGVQISACNLPVAITAACLLVAGTQSGIRSGNLIRTALSWSPLVWLGSFSYSFYLLHEPIVNWFWLRFLMRHPLSHTTALIVFAGVVFPGIILVSYLFHLVFERPFMSTPPPKSEKQAAQAAITSPAP